jgi:hypothetical protein
MELVDLLKRLGAELAMNHGYTRTLDENAAASVARILTNSTDVLTVFAHWLGRSPEALSMLVEHLGASPPEGAASDDSGVRFLKFRPGNASGLGGFGVPVAPVRTVRAEDLQAEFANTVKEQGGDTRRLDSAFDVPVIGADGTELWPCKGPTGQESQMQILSVAGNVLMVRDVKSGAIWNASVLHIRPDVRAKAQEAIARHPRYAVDTNFDPWSALTDPWADTTDMDAPAPPVDIKAAQRMTPTGYHKRPCVSCGEFKVVAAGTVRSCDACGHREEVKGW